MTEMSILSSIARHFKSGTYMTTSSSDITTEKCVVWSHAYTCVTWASSHQRARTTYTASRWLEHRTSGKTLVSVTVATAGRPSKCKPPVANSCCQSAAIREIRHMTLPIIRQKQKNLQFPSQVTLSSIRNCYAKISHSRIPPSSQQLPSASSIAPVKAC
jgi:hypothetical protein